VIVALDTNVLVGWLMEGAHKHEACRSLAMRLIRSDAHQVGLTSQVMWEWIHVVTDGRRFEHPMPMAEALTTAQRIWTAQETHPIETHRDVVPSVCQTMAYHGLGRKRVLDTALAMHLQLAGVTHLATLNDKDFRQFAFLTLIIPGQPLPSSFDT